MAGVSPINNIYNTLPHSRVHEALERLTPIHNNASTLRFQSNYNTPVASNNMYNNPKRTHDILKGNTYLPINNDANYTFTKVYEYHFNMNERKHTLYDNNIDDTIIADTNAILSSLNEYKDLSTPYSDTLLCLIKRAKRGKNALVLVPFFYKEENKPQTPINVLNDDYLASVITFINKGYMRSLKHVYVYKVVDNDNYYNELPPRRPPKPSGGSRKYKSKKARKTRSRKSRKTKKTGGFKKPFKKPIY
jgi:hypothetical protein